MGKGKYKLRWQRQGVCSVIYWMSREIHRPNQLALNRDLKRMLLQDLKNHFEIPARAGGIEEWVIEEAAEKE